MAQRCAPVLREEVLHVRQLTADELEALQARKRIFKESAWDEWRTTQPLAFDEQNREFVVPADFPTDLVSVPNIVSWFIPRAGRYARAAVLHDYLLRYSQRLGIDPRRADTCFRRQMQRDGISLLRRWIMWAAVRMASILRGKGGAGWWQDALVALPLLLFIALPIVILPVIAIAVSTVAFWLLESFVALLVPDEPPVPLPLKT